MSDELYGELFAVVCAKRMHVNTSLGKEEALTDALMPFVERRVAEAKAEADRWQEAALMGLAGESRERDRAEVAEARLATVRADMHLTQMTPDPNDPGAYVLGGDAEEVLAVEQEGENNE